MRAKLGTIKGSRIGKNRDSQENSRLLNAEITSPNDIQTVELITESGTDFNPEDDDVVLVISLGDAFKMGLIVDDQIEPDGSIEKGEKEIFSKADGQKLAKLKLDKDGQVILNDGADFAVKFNELKAQVDQLKIELDSHIHTGVTSGGSTSGTPATPFTINVDNTKAEKVRL